MIMLFISIHRSMEYIKLMYFLTLTQYCISVIKKTIGYDVLGFCLLWGGATEFYLLKLCLKFVNQYL